MPTSFAPHPPTNLESTEGVVSCKAFTSIQITTSLLNTSPLSSSPTPSFSKRIFYNDSTSSSLLVQSLTILNLSTGYNPYPQTLSTTLLTNIPCTLPQSTFSRS